MSLQALWPLTTQFQNKNGAILTSGRVYVYYKNRTALAEIFSDEDGTVVNSNPVLLDNNGRATAFVNSIYSYTIVVCDYYGKELFSQDITLPSGEGPVSNVQTVAYGITAWNNIDFTKQLLLRYIVDDTVVASAAYTATDSALKFYVDIENEVYEVQLLHDTDEWTATKVDSSSVYEAVWGQSLTSLNRIPSGVLVYTKYHGLVYMNSYRSDTEWRFTNIDGDVINEAKAVAEGWTEDSNIIGGGSANVVMSYGETPTQSFSDLTALAAKGLLYARKETTVFQAVAWSSYEIEFFSVHGRYTENWKYNAYSGWSSHQTQLQQELTPGAGIDITNNTISLKYTVKEI